MKTSPAFAGRIIPGTKSCSRSERKAIPRFRLSQQIIRDFPERSIRLLLGVEGHTGANDKVAKLCRLEEEAKYSVLVISDSDVRVSPDYLCGVVAPLRRRACGDGDRALPVFGCAFFWSDDGCSRIFCIIRWFGSGSAHTRRAGICDGLDDRHYS